MKYGVCFRGGNSNHEPSLVSANDCENILKTYANNYIKNSDDEAMGSSTFAKWIDAGEGAAAAARVAKKVCAAARIHVQVIS